MIGSGARSLLAGRDGTTAVEFALASMALVLFVFGAVEMGRMLWTQQVLQSVATDTARCLAIGSGNCPDGGSYAVSAAVKRGLNDVQSAEVAVSLNDSCGSAVGLFTKVTITYPFAPVLPAYIPSPAGGLTASACFPHD